MVKERMSIKGEFKISRKSHVLSLSHRRARTELNLVPTFARTRTLANNKIRTRIGTSARNNFMCTFMTRNHALNSTQIHLLSSPFPRDFSHRQCTERKRHHTTSFARKRTLPRERANAPFAFDSHHTRTFLTVFVRTRPIFYAYKCARVQLVYTGVFRLFFQRLCSSRVSKTLN